MNGKGARQKGLNFERRVANDLKTIFGDESIRRGLQFRSSYFKKATEDDVPDVIAPLISPECKCYKANAPIRKAYEHASEVSEKLKDNKIPVAITKDNNREPLATLSYIDFLYILSELSFSGWGKSEALYTFPKDVMIIFKDKIKQGWYGKE